MFLIIAEQGTALRSKTENRPLFYCSKVRCDINMEFLFENIWGIIIGILIISLVTFIKYSFTEDSSINGLIIELIGFAVWYIITVIINFTLPSFKILHENKIYYAVISIVILNLFSKYLESRTEDGSWF